MTLLVVLLLLALLFGVGGAVKGLLWLWLIAVVLGLVGLGCGWNGYRGSRL